MTKILICGSRATNITLIEQLMAFMDNLRYRQCSVIVGDAQGVDWHVIMLCEAYNIPYTVFGISAWDNPRGQVRSFSKERYFVLSEDGYLARDRYMVMLADEVHGFWNGLSRGTKYTCDYAVKLGKLTELHTYRAPDK